MSEIDLSSGISSNGFLTKSQIDSFDKSIKDKEYVKLKDEIKTELLKELTVQFDRFKSILLEKDLKRDTEYKECNLKLREELLRLKEEIFLLKTYNTNKENREKNIQLRSHIPFPFNNLNKILNI